jgi:hypothetical protein
MRTLVFFLSLAAAPALLGQSAVPFAALQGAPLPSHPGNLTVLTPQAQDWWAQHPNGGRHGPLLAEDRPFAFAMPSPQEPAGKMEPIPTQWPNAKFEAIPTRWKNLKVVPADGGGAVTPGNCDAALFVRPGRK